MTSDISLLLALKVSLSRAVDGWPDAEQGANTVTANLSGVDLAVWNNAYIAKLAIAGGATTTVDLMDFETLLLEENVAFEKVFGIIVQVALADVDNTDATLTLVPGGTNPLQWFFTSDNEGVVVDVGDTLFRMCAKDNDGYAVDTTHKELDFTNTGSDDLIATVIILGSVPDA